MNSYTNIDGKRVAKRTNIHGVPTKTGGEIIIIETQYEDGSASSLIQTSAGFVVRTAEPPRGSDPDTLPPLPGSV